MKNFFELRRGVENLGEMVAEFVTETLYMMDEQGIAMTARKPRKVNGEIHRTPAATKNVERLREKARGLYAKRKNASSGKRHGVEPDGNHLTIGEAARILKMSDANVRLMMHNGKIDAPVRYENRPTSAGHTLPVLVLHKDVVAKAAVEHPISKAHQASSRRARAKRKKKS